MTLPSWTFKIVKYVQTFKQLQAFHLFSYWLEEAQIYTPNSKDQAMCYSTPLVHVMIFQID